MPGPGPSIPRIAGGRVFLRKFFIAKLMLIVLLAAARGQDRGAVQRPVPLSELMRAEWGARAPWNDGLSEIAEYQARFARDGVPVEGRLVLVTGQEDFSRESLARAAWPYGARPVVEAMRQRAFLRGSDGDAGTALADTWADRRAPVRLLRILVAEVRREGALVRDFDFTGATPQERFTSFRDDEGTGVRSVDSPQEAVFEEQLPLIVRGLRFAEGAEAWLALMEPVSDGRAMRPKSSLAVLRITREGEAPRLPLRTWQGEAPWRVSIESGDGRRIECLVAAEAPHTLLLLEHSNGSGLALSALRRGVFGN